jgi:hypothetical protein
MHDEPVTTFPLFRLYLCLSLDANHPIAALDRSFERLPLRISARWANLWVYPCIHLQALVCLTWFSRILYIRPYLTMWFAFFQLIPIVLSEIPFRQSRPNPVAEIWWAAHRSPRLRLWWILYIRPHLGMPEMDARNGQGPSSVRKTLSNFPGIGIFQVFPKYWHGSPEGFTWVLSCEDECNFRWPPVKELVASLRVRGISVSGSCRFVMPIRFNQTDSDLRHNGFCQNVRTVHHRFADMHIR